MTIVVVPHRNKNKGGAAEHVDAIVDALQKQDSGLIIAKPIESRYGQVAGKETLLPLQDDARAIYETHGAANYIIVTGDYGADLLESGARACDDIKAGFSGGNVKILMSSYSVEPKQILPALASHGIDYLAVPTHAVEPHLLDASAKRAVTEAGSRIMRTVGIPNEATPELCRQKWFEWFDAANEGRVEALTLPGKDTHLSLIVMPGDVETQDGRPVLFTEQHAEQLADAIADQLPDGANKILLSNGPRTGKYNAALLDAPDFDACNPAFHNKARFQGLAAGPVANAFYERLSSRVGKTNIVDGCIAKGIVPRAGYLAFIDYANDHVALGGTAAAYIDGASSTMLTQFVDNLDPRVSVIACDTPAKNETHVACMEDRYKRNEAGILKLADGAYSLQSAGQRPDAAIRQTDAEAIAAKIIDLAQESAPAPVRMMVMSVQSRLARHELRGPA